MDIHSDLNGEEFVRSLCKKEFEKTNQKEFRVEKVIKRKRYKLYAKGKATIILLMVGLIKRYRYIK